eukprot:CAMPEP_0202832638 /NCGR_PEP_ID=MMETSP1389-20130828/20358_1 /ASSEMBLY_ACC=CAM_ASM_000865 /TAXON_ID=302021 /ORGANISM="Rhodomonas sp., Strain CCMP768" /LENGTH=91 /DNA_ID=CAMNT_0049506751 /DNA_START=21 /DNA_END=296 /DNA_ORIENTATION=+
MSALQRTMAFGAIAAASLSVVAVSYQQESALKKRNSQSLHSEGQGILNPKEVTPLSATSLAHASQEAAKLKHRNSGNYYGLMTGEYSEAKK